MTETENTAVLVTKTVQMVKPRRQSIVLAFVNYLPSSTHGKALLISTGTSNH
jgi:hypothetical protein